MKNASSTRARRTALLGLAVSQILWGLSYPAQKQALDGLPPATVTLVRNAAAILVLALLAGRQRFAWRAVDGRDWRLALLLGVFGFALPMYLGIAGVERSSAAAGSILVLLEPVTIVLVAWLLLGERVGARRASGMALGLAGALFVVFEGASFQDLFGGEHLLGHGLLALHGCLWALYTLIGKPLTERHDPVGVSLLAALFGMVVFVPAAILELDAWRGGPALAPALAWSVALGVIVSAGCTVLWFTALRHLANSAVAPFIFLQPFAGVLAGSALLGERLSSSAIAGGALILVGVGLALVPSRPRGEVA